MTDIPDFDITMSDDVRSVIAMQNFDAMLSDHMRVFQAQREEQIRAQLIELGWTPPGGAPREEARPVGGMTIHTAVKVTVDADALIDLALRAWGDFTRRIPRPAPQRSYQLHLHCHPAVRTAIIAAGVAEPTCMGAPVAFTTHDTWDVQTITATFEECP